MGDIKNMYTNVPLDKLQTDIKWFLDHAERIGLQHGITVPHGKTYRPHFGKPGNPKRATHLSREFLEEILLFDVNNIFFTLGDRLTQQIMGVPMGSPCSPALAVGLCMRAEHDHIQIHGRTHIRAGFRYIDDLLLFVDPTFDREHLKEIFPQPLELEVEDHNGPFRFLMSWNIFQPDGALTTHCELNPPTAGFWPAPSRPETETEKAGSDQAP